MMKNPYYLSFHLVLGVMLMTQAKKRADSGVEEPIEVLFDAGMDRLQSLRIGFNYLINTVATHNPEFLDLLINKEAEFRDDKLFKPLQAADLLAWHVDQRPRRFASSTAQNCPDFRPSISRRALTVTQQKSD
jgi:hypothetical protein